MNILKEKNLTCTKIFPYPKAGFQQQLGKRQNDVIDF